MDVPERSMSGGEVGARGCTGHPDMGCQAYSWWWGRCTAVQVQVCMYSYSYRRTGKGTAICVKLHIQVYRYRIVCIATGTGVQLYRYSYMCEATDTGVQDKECLPSSRVRETGSELSPIHLPPRENFPKYMP